MLSVELERVILQQLEDLGCPFALKCAILWRYGEWDSLLTESVNVDDYATDLDYYLASQALALFKKLNGLLDNAEDRTKRAVVKWYEGEASCYRTNLRLTAYLSTNHAHARDERLDTHIRGVREVVRELIGDRPPEFFERRGRFGPGATFLDTGGKATVPHKIDANPTLTSKAVWYLWDFLQTKWGQAVINKTLFVKLEDSSNPAENQHPTHIESPLIFLRGDRYSRANKTSWIDRSITIGPSINGFYQLAVGSCFRSTLRFRTGWDLDYAQDIHRLIARESSRTRRFATADLVNASDTVCYNLVKLVTPRPWFDVMDDLRSPMTRITYSSDGSKTPERWVKLEKFSSMGNGFTFELETVIFAAIAIYCNRLHGHQGVLGYDTFVFGDDIILEDDAFETVKWLLAFFGFEINVSKSFHGMSPFRESCGADFYNGSDVRPIYLREDPRDPKGAIGITNRLGAILGKAASLGANLPCRAYNLAMSLVPLPFRNCRGPKDLGDSVIWDTEARFKWRNGIKYYRACLPGDVKIVRFDKFVSDVVLACATYGTGNEGTPRGGRIPGPEGVTPRDPIRSYTTGWLARS